MTTDEEADVHDPASLIQWHIQRARVGARLEAISRYVDDVPVSARSLFLDETEAVGPVTSRACQGARVS